MRVAPAASSFVALAVLAAAFAAGTTGCGAPRPVIVDFSETPRDYSAKDYDAVYKRWTRHERALNQFDVALEVWATFKSWDFREAYIERYASIYGLSDADRSALRQAQLETFRHGYEFHVTAQSTSYRWNDLEKASSAWRVTLIDAAGHELTPDYVRVEKLPDAYERVFFPDRTPFTRSYSIRFQVPPASGQEFMGVKSGGVTLRMTSPIGHVDPTWRGKS